MASLIEQPVDATWWWPIWQQSQQAVLFIFYCVPIASTELCELVMACWRNKCQVPTPNPEFGVKQEVNCYRSGKRTQIMCQTGGKLCIKGKTREHPAGYISNLPGLKIKGQTRLNVTIMPEKVDKPKIVSKVSTLQHLTLWRATSSM